MLVSEISSELILSGEDGNLSGVTEHNTRFRLDGVPNVRDSLILIRNDSIVITNEKPADIKLNSFKGKVTEMIPSEYGMEVTVDTGDLFYADTPVSEIDKLRLSEGKEVWISFPSDSIVVIGGN